MEEKQLNIYQKMEQIGKPVEVIKKNARAYGYNYVTEEEILAKIKSGMAKYHVSLIPEIVPGTTKVVPYTYTKTKAAKTGEIYEEINNEILVQSDMVFSWINNDDPTERIVVPWSMVGQQGDASQSFGSGLTYCTRYFELKYFNVATSDDDPDAWRAKKMEAEAEEDKLVAEKIIEQVNTLVLSHLENNPDDRDLIKTITKKYAKEKGKASANYYAIVESTVAAQLLEELKANLVEKPEEKESK